MIFNHETRKSSFRIQGAPWILAVQSLNPNALMLKTEETEYLSVIVSKAENHDENISISLVADD